MTDKASVVPEGVKVEFVRVDLVSQKYDKSTEDQADMVAVSGWVSVGSYRQYVTRYIPIAEYREFKQQRKDIPAQMIMHLEDALRSELVRTLDVNPDRQALFQLHQFVSDVVAVYGCAAPDFNVPDVATINTAIRENVLELDKISPRALLAMVEDHVARQWVMVRDGSRHILRDYHPDGTTLWRVGFMTKVDDKNAMFKPIMSGPTLIPLLSLAGRAGHVFERPKVADVTG